MNKQALFNLLDNSFSASRMREVIRICRQYGWPLGDEEKQAIIDHTDRMDAKCVIQPRERERLAKLYPLFAFTFSDKTGEPNSVAMGRSIWHFWKDGHETERYLDSSHRNTAMEAELSEAYPHLKFLFQFHRNGVGLSAWCKAGTGTAVNEEFDLLQPNLHDRLNHFNEQAALAGSDGYFYCTGHDRAEPEAEFDYFYFAGRYCHEWAAASPEHKAAAGRETYE